MIAVTGGAGLIGGTIIKLLNDSGEDRVLLVDDLSRPEKFVNVSRLRFTDYMDHRDFRAAMKDPGFSRKIKAISHQGARADTMERDGRFMMDVNFACSKDLFHAAMDANIPFVYASSAAVYGGANVFDDDNLHTQPLNVYGLSKLQMDRYAGAAAKPKGWTCVGLRYFNVYGVFESHKGRMASMPYQLWKQIQTTGVARLFGEGLGYGPGEHERDFVYAEDVARVNLFFLLGKGVGAHGVFNCGSGKRRSFNDVARTLIASMGRGTIEYFPFPEELLDKYQARTEANIGKLRRVGFDQPMSTLEQGLTHCARAWSQA
ncbi:MAG: ADP-glyceromanno-heptose 6-epimerase [Phycisphaeraceae bacterium]|nr:ADP-glyceromanno-heptose 6-epimerase [Phycisphaeraceae bacterium]